MFQLVDLILVEYLPETLVLQQIVLLLLGLLQSVHEAAGAYYKIALLAVVGVERRRVLFVEDRAQGADKGNAKV